MSNDLLMKFIVDKENCQLKIEREFNAEVELVWKAWTTPEILEQWWAPKPWKAESQSMDFREGGHWLYAMVSPEGEKHYGRMEYIKIVNNEMFEGLDIFCDAEGNVNKDLPQSKWENTFTNYNDNTLVTVITRYESLEQLEAILNMGMKEGLTMALQNLDQYLEAQGKLKAQAAGFSKVNTYLNFPGNTEEVFNFYKKVFKSEFINGVQRFGDLPSNAEHPPVAESVKNMILHIALPIFGNHLLMGTDAPKEMGFEVIQGNNMHISIEPESREECQRIFNELSEGGKIEMPLDDMFWGAYFGSFSDRYGINWMINYHNQK